MSDSAVDLSVTVHVECRLSDVQQSGDDFELTFPGWDGDQPLWLSKDEVLAFRDRLTAALVAYDHANQLLDEVPEFPSGVKQGASTGGT